MSYICDYFPHKQFQENKTAVKSVDFTPVQIKKAYCNFIIIIFLLYIATSLVT